MQILEQRRSEMLFVNHLLNLDYFIKTLYLYLYKLRSTYKEFLSPLQTFWQALQQKLEEPIN